MGTKESKLQPQKISYAIDSFWEKTCLEKLNKYQDIFDLCEKLQVNFNPYYYRLFLPQVMNNSFVKLFQERFHVFMMDESKNFDFVEIPKIELSEEQKKWFQSKRKVFEENNHPFHFLFNHKQKQFTMIFYSNDENIKNWFKKYFSNPEENPHRLTIEYLIVQYH